MGNFSTTSIGRFEVSFDSTVSAGSNALLYPYHWAKTSLTFSFPDSSSDYTRWYGSGESHDGFKQLNDKMADGVREALRQMSEFTDLTFTELSGSSDKNADIRVAHTSATSTAFAYFPVGGEEAGDVWVSGNKGAYNWANQGTYSFHTLLHELGHSMGLKHGHEDGIYGAMPSAIDAMQYTVMTYRSYVGTNKLYYTNSTDGFAQTYMTYDMAALQSLYGVNWSTRATDTTFAWDEKTGAMVVDGTTGEVGLRGYIFETIWDGGGYDTLDLRNHSSNAAIDLTPGGGQMFSDAQLANLGNGNRSDANVYLPFLPDGDERALIEAVKTGSGDDTINGNQAHNRLVGWDGADSINGGEGRDRLFGNAGDDTLNGGDANDRLFGQANKDMLDGGAGKDFLFGGRGADILMGGSGADVLVGGRGRDVLTGGSGADVFQFAIDDGRDRITDFNKDMDFMDLPEHASPEIEQRGDDAILTYSVTGRITLEMVQADTFDWDTVLI